METPSLYCLPLHPFLKFCPHTPTPTSLSPSTPAPTVLSVVMFLWLNGWSCHIWCAILINHNMDLYMSSLGTLIPEGPWCVFHATRQKVYWSLKFTLIWYQSHTTHTTLSGHSRLTQSYKYIFTPSFMCS